VNSVVRHTKRVIVTVMGATVVLAGIAMLVLPGPGWVAIIAGLAILATEYVWARKLLEKAKHQATKSAKAVGSGLKRPFGRRGTGSAVTEEVGHEETS
jgi:uncharacterized protein (TIGR02611 family)